MGLLKTLTAISHVVLALAVAPRRQPKPLLLDVLVDDEVKEAVLLPPKPPGPLGNRFPSSPRQNQPVAATFDGNAEPLSAVDQSH